MIANAVVLRPMRPVAEAIAFHGQLVDYDETLFDGSGNLLASAKEAAASERAIVAAFDKLMAAPCHTLDDVRAKVAYILDGTVGERDPLLCGLAGPEGSDPFAPDGLIASLLRSFAGGMSEASAVTSHVRAREEVRP